MRSLDMIFKSSGVLTGVETANRCTRSIRGGRFIVRAASAQSPQGSGVLDKPTVEKGNPGRESEADLKKAWNLSPRYQGMLHDDSHKKRIIGTGSLQIRNGSSLVGPTLPENLTRDTLSTLVAPVADDLRILNEDLHTIVGDENPLLMAAAEQIFSAGGKRLRPALVFLVSKATVQMAGLESMGPQHWRLAQVIEMIHTASLMHDDVLDESDTRRGKDTIHSVFGTRIAVLAGDFMFAQSSWYLANLDNLEVIKLISQVIKDFASGEIKQAMSLFDCDLSLQDYLDKSYYKTASLIAASTRSAAIFSGMDKGVCDQMYDYGLHLGLAFQVVDDILDFTQSSEQLGKPAGSDLAKGNLTAPVLFALQSEPRLRELIDNEFSDEGSLDAAISLVYRGGGIDKARQLATDEGMLAMKNLEFLPHSPLRRSLEGIVDYVLERIF